MNRFMKLAVLFLISGLGAWVAMANAKPLHDPQPTDAQDVKATTPANPTAKPTKKQVASATSASPSRKQDELRALTRELELLEARLNHVQAALRMLRMRVNVEGAGRGGVFIDDPDSPRPFNEGEVENGSAR